MSFAEKLRTRWQMLLELRAYTGRSLFRILSEIAACRWDGFAPWEYLLFQFYERENFNRRHLFAGYREMGRLDDSLNARSSWVLADDKLLCLSILVQAGLPVPRVRAIFSPSPRACVLAEVTRDPESVSAVLERLDFPLFLKPIAGGRGIGCCRVDSWDGRLLQTSLGELDLDQFAEVMTKEAFFGDPGVFMSELIRPHRILRCFHATTSTVRFCVVVTENGPIIVRATLRIAEGRQSVDNFDPFRGLNMISRVDPLTGVAGPAVSGLGLSERVLTHHPDSGAAITGVQLPDWQRAREVVLEGSLLFPGLRFQHWDVALSDSGPVVIELNVRGGLYATMQPFFDEEMREILSLAAR